MTGLFVLHNIIVVLILALGGMLMAQAFKLAPHPAWPFIVSGLWGIMVYFIIKILN
jgi:hypothetical protein